MNKEDILIAIADLKLAGHNVYNDNIIPHHLARAENENKIRYYDTVPNSIKTAIVALEKMLEVE